jgi:hypothetical protein
MTLLVVAVMDRCMSFLITIHEVMRTPKGRETLRLTFALGGMTSRLRHQKHIAIGFPVRASVLR